MIEDTWILPKLLIWPLGAFTVVCRLMSKQPKKTNVPGCGGGSRNGHQPLILGHAPIPLFPWPTCATPTT